MHALMGRPTNVSSLPDIALADTATNEASIDDLLHDVLRTIRGHLGMDVAFVSEFVDGRRYFRYIDAGVDNPPMMVGGSDPLNESYCAYVVAGLLPQLIRDASLVPLALTFPATTELPVGAHISVPIHLSDGRVYGTFCCFKSVADLTLVDRDLALVQMFAEFAGKRLERELAARRTFDEITKRIQATIESQAFSVVYQPIYHFVEDRIVGFEALSRFSTLPLRPPNVWFDEATHVGLVEVLEAAVIAKALQGFAYLPEDVYIALNVSPMTLMSGALARVLEQVPLTRIVLEVTEHTSIPDYARLMRALKPLRKQGLRLAVDDAGAGYASFRHILQLDPDLIKLDISLTRNIDVDRTRRALAAALVRFAEETGSKIIAEGVETEAELEMLRHLRISKAQGYLIGRPAPLTSTVAHRKPHARLDDGLTQQHGGAG